jgi:hypothetical protein
MPTSHNINYYLGRMEDESLADALADFEDPLEGRSVDLLSSLDIDDDLDDYAADYDDY